MTVQAGLCQTCSETTLLVFPRGGSNTLKAHCFNTTCICSNSVFQQSFCFLRNLLITKHAHMIYSNFFRSKIDNFQRKSFDIFLIFAFDIFLIFAQNIDCGYTLEPPRRGGSNEYPQYMFWSKNKKNRYTRAYPSFSI